MDNDVKKNETKKKGTSTTKKKTSSIKSATAKKKTTSKKTTSTKKTTSSKKPATVKKTTSTAAKKKTTSSAKTTTKKKSTKTTTKKKVTTTRKTTIKKPAKKEVVKEQSFDYTGLVTETPVIEENLDEKIDELLEGVEDNIPVEEPKAQVEKEIEPIIEKEVVEEKVIEEKVVEEPIQEQKPVVKKKKILKGWVYIVLMAICVCLLIFFVFRLINVEPLNTSLTDKYVYIKDKQLFVDFEKLKQENADTIGYIKLEGTDINHIVVKGEDNDYYRTHDFTKKENSDGWVFIDANNKLDGTDRNIIIYGNANSRIFGSLSNVLNKKWQEEKHYITFVTESFEYHYEIISTYKTKDAINYIYDNQINYFKYMTNLVEKSNYQYDVTISSYDDLLTLVSIDGEDRIVLHARRVRTPINKSSTIR